MASIPGNETLDVEDQKENINDNNNCVNGMFDHDDGFMDTVPNGPSMPNEAHKEKLAQKTAPELLQMRERYLREEYNFAKDALQELCIEVDPAFCVYNARKLGLLKSFDKNFNNSNNVIVNNNMNNLGETESNNNEMFMNNVSKNEVNNTELQPRREMIDNPDEPAIDSYILPGKDVLDLETSNYLNNENKLDDSSINSVCLDSVDEALNGNSSNVPGMGLMNFISPFWATRHGFIVSSADCGELCSQSQKSVMGENLKKLIDRGINDLCLVTSWELYCKLEYGIFGKGNLPVKHNVETIRVLSRTYPDLYEAFNSIVHDCYECDLHEDIVKIIVNHLGYEGKVGKFALKIVNDGNNKDLFMNILDKIAMEIMEKYSRRSNYILLSMKFNIEYHPSECMIASYIEGECIRLLKLHNMIKYRDVNDSNPLNKDNENDKNAGNK